LLKIVLKHHKPKPKPSNRQLQMYLCVSGIDLNSFSDFSIGLLYCYDSVIYCFFFLHFIMRLHGYVPLVVNTSRSCPHSWLITGFVTRLTRRVPLVEHELLALPEHTSSSLGFSGVRVPRSLVLYVYFVDRCLFFCTFSFNHCVVCPSSIYGFWLPLWYIQTLLQ
jgi:hypothetical protein